MWISASTCTNQPRHRDTPTMGFNPIVGTLSYLWDRASDEVLLIRRNARSDDTHFGKVNGLGGKVEVDEDILSSARRELNEEAGISDATCELRGTITFTDFGPDREQWLVFVFVVPSWTGEIGTTNAEGRLEWVPRRDLLAACDPGPEADRLPMWPGDRNFLPLVFDDDPAVFHATMPYDGDRPLRWSYVRT